MKNKQKEGKQIQQDLNKAQEKKKAALEAMCVRCKICFKEISPIPRCFGHGSGGGSGGGGAGDSAGKGNNSYALSNGAAKIDMVHFGVDSASYLNGVNVNDCRRVETIGGKFNPAIIAEMVEKKLLMIENNPENGSLLIRLLCDHKLLSKEQNDALKKFMEEILKELKDFIKSKGIGADCHAIERDKSGNIVLLRIALPTPKLYREFMQQLANNLLPISIINQQERKSEEKRNYFIPKSFSNKPNPMQKNMKKSLLDDLEGLIHKYLSKDKTKFFSIPSPADRPKLKPKGYK